MVLIITVGELIGTATKDKNGLMPASMAKLEGFQDNVSSGKFIKIVNRNPLAYSRSLIRVNVCPSNNFGNEGVFSAVIMASNETGEQKYRAITTGDTSMAVLYYNEEGLFLKNNYKYSASVFIELAAKSRDELVGEILSVEPSSIIEL